MRYIRLEAVVGACSLAVCLSVPVALHAQADPSNPNPGTATPGAQVGTPSPTTTQQTPGVRHASNNSQNGNSTAEPGGGGMGADSAEQGMKDKMFLKTAAQGGMVEIAAGQMASSQASDSKVKAFGQRMVTDHTMLNNDLKPFADRMGVQPPDKPKAEDQAELDKLKGLSGADFDKEYVSFMMKDHAEDAKDFSAEASSTSDQDLKMAVMKGQQVILQHKKMIDKIGSSMGVAAQ